MRVAPEGRSQRYVQRPDMPRWARSCRWQRVARVRRIPWHPVQRAPFRPL